MRFNVRLRSRSLIPSNPPRLTGKGFKFVIYMHYADSPFKYKIDRADMNFAHSITRHLSHETVRSRRRFRFPSLFPFPSHEYKLDFTSIPRIPAPSSSMVQRQRLGVRGISREFTFSLFSLSRESAFEPRGAPTEGESSARHAL